MGAGASTSSNDYFTSITDDIMNYRITVQDALDKFQKDGKDGKVDVNKFNMFLLRYGVSFIQLRLLKNSDEIIHQIIIDFANFVKTEQYNTTYETVVKEMIRNKTLSGGKSKKSKRKRKNSRRRNTRNRK